ncbi:hypothetical protein [Streptomyces sp. NPDC050428]|uniref:hypothetical protein n=1 Tax=Streptomyces sp. NPDC050428 TaxID=3155757 RepID=UPI003447D68D
MPSTSASTAPSASSAKEATRIPFRERYHAVQHGGIVRAANSAVTCRTTGRNLRVGEQKPPKGNGRVLIAEPGGAYKEVLSERRRVPGAAGRRSSRTSGPGTRCAIWPSGGAGAIGVVSYDGDPGTGGDSVTVRTGRGIASSVSDSANPTHDVMNSSIADDGSNHIKRQPAYKNTLGYDSDVFDLREALVSGGDTMNVSFRTGCDSVWLGAFFVAVDARR